MKTQGEIKIYRSELIDQGVFWHGFPERTGGVSTDERSSLNLGHRWGDSPENIQRNRELVAEKDGFRFEDLVVTKHVHGTDVWRVGEAAGEEQTCRQVSGSSRFDSDASSSGTLT